MLPNPNEPNFVVTQDPARNRWLYFTNPLLVLSANTADQVKSILAQVEHETKYNQRYDAGFVNYEAASAFDHVYPTKNSQAGPLIWFGIYEDFTEIDYPGAKRMDDLDWEIQVAEKQYKAALDKIKPVTSGFDYRFHDLAQLKSRTPCSPIFPHPITSK